VEGKSGPPHLVVDGMMCTYLFGFAGSSRPLRFGPFALLTPQHRLSPLLKLLLGSP